MEINMIRNDVYEIEVGGRTFIGSQKSIERPTKTIVMGTSLYEQSEFLKNLYILELTGKKPVKWKRNDLRLLFIEIGE